jgi:two-component system sensor histidine kinase RegB
MTSSEISAAREAMGGGEPPGSLKAPQDGPQDAWSAWLGATRQGKLRLRTLVAQRWLAIGGQVAAVLIVGFGLGYHLPYALVFSLIALSAWLNVLFSLASPGQRLARNLEAAIQLAFDTVQLGAVLFLTGGALNPFCILLIAPVALAAATLPLRHTLALGVLAIIVLVAISFWSFPLPTPTPEPFNPPLMVRVGALIAEIVAIVVIAFYAWQAATEAARMELALNVTQTVLAREQRLSALGALAAAAAHELGTPLATISVVAREMVRNAPNDEVREDAELMSAQAIRCREILKKLGETPDQASDIVHERMSLLQFVQEAIEPHTHIEGVRIEAIVSGGPDSDGEAPPDMWRMPEVLHAITSMVENAVDFARSEVLVSARFDKRSVSVEVRDDGPGFAPEVLAKLGEPYVTSRRGEEGGRTGHVGMGLGFFIAKTLLERTGARVDFRNGKGPPGRLGAIVSARWPRAAIEAPGYDEAIQGL